MLRRRTPTRRRRRAAGPRARRRSPRAAPRGRGAPPTRRPKQGRRRAPRAPGRAAVRVRRARRRRALRHAAHRACRRRYRPNRAVSALYSCLDSGVSTSRLLELLEVLQTKPLVTGRELGDRLGVDRRTVRRDVAALQRLGIPVEGERGVGGGYRLRPGYRLPPLMLTEDEATAVVLGLTAARRLALGDADGADGALSKIHRV